MRNYSLSYKSLIELFAESRRKLFLSLCLYLSTLVSSTLRFLSHLNLFKLFIEHWINPIVIEPFYFCFIFVLTFVIVVCLLSHTRGPKVEQTRDSLKQFPSSWNIPWYNFCVPKKRSDWSGAAVAYWLERRIRDRMKISSASSILPWRILFRKFEMLSESCTITAVINYRCYPVTPSRQQPKYTIGASGPLAMDIN